MENINIQKSKREIWLDFIKILACIMVIILHTISFGLEKNIISRSLVIYYIGTFAIPLFFMVNGYLQLRRNVSYKYALKKILKILLVAFFWNLMIIIFKLLVKGEFTNPITSTFKSFIQVGNFTQFWFLGSLILIYLILPLLGKLFNNTNKAYKYFTLGLLVVCLLVDLLNIYNYHNGRKIVKDTVIQTFRLWTWLFYFCVGGVLNKNDLFQKVPTKLHMILCIILIFSTIAYCFLFSIKLYGSLFAENMYDSFLVILTTVFIFSGIKKIKFKNKKVIEKLSSLTMGVYIIHWHILGIIRSVVPSNNTIILNLLTVIIVYIISNIVSYIISKVPKLKNMIKL